MRGVLARGVAVCLATLAVARCASTPQAPAAHGRERQAAGERLMSQAEALTIKPAISRNGMVATACAPASWAGARLLAAGGNAIDAAVAAAFALGVADPGASGVGGETIMLVRLADGRSVVIDGSARAPLRSSALELQGLRERARWRGLVYGYKSVATPGTVAALSLALRRYGTKSLFEVVAPAIELAEFGTVWTPTHRAFLQKYGQKVHDSPYLSRLFMKDGIEVWDEHHVYCNPDLACFLRRLAGAGAHDFYRGAIAREIERDMIAHGGWLRLADLELMDAEERPPLAGRYRGLEVLSAPLPASGSQLIELLAILDRFPPSLLIEPSVDRLHLLLEAAHIAFVDSFPFRRPPRSPDELAADPAHVAARARLIRFDRATTDREISANDPATIATDGTVHVATADAAGNVVSLTQTLGAQFGGGAATEGWGFAYNSLVNNFDFKDARAWEHLAPRRLVRSTLAPAIVLEGGKPLLVLGSAGTARIAPLTAATIVAVVDGGLPLAEAIAHPKALWDGFAEDHTFLELVAPIDEAAALTLSKRGFVGQKRLTYPASPLDVSDFGGVNAIWIDPLDGTMVGVGDARRFGAAVAPESIARQEAERILLPDCWRSL